MSPNLQALATRLLQTVGSKRVANAQTMETMVASKQALCHSKLKILGLFETAIK